MQFEGLGWGQAMGEEDVVPKTTNRSCGVHAHEYTCHAHTLAWALTQPVSPGRQRDKWAH